MNLPNVNKDCYENIIKRCQDLAKLGELAFYEGILNKIKLENPNIFATVLELANIINEEFQKMISILENQDDKLITAIIRYLKYLQEFSSKIVTLTSATVYNLLDSQLQVNQMEREIKI